MAKHPHPGSIIPAPEPDIVDVLRRDRLVSGRSVSAKPLGGGVSSEVYLIADDENRFVVKRALHQLKVKDLWLADTSRNRHEYEYLKYVSRILPGSVPSVFFLGDDYFTMEYLGPEFRNWKQMLLAGDCEPWHVQQAASALARIHKTSAEDPDVKRVFDTTKNFHQLRTDPYLLTTGERHPELREYFEQEAVRLERTRECLVHGDYSPKNMFIGNGRFVLVDCEVAWYGDPAFDLAFLLNHLLLKTLYHFPRNPPLAALIASAIETYYSERKLGSLQSEFDSRTARILLLLLLARIDGKSPVEYLAEEEKRQFVRGFVTSALKQQLATLGGVVEKWCGSLRIPKGGITMAAEQL